MSMAVATGQGTLKRRGAVCLSVRRLAPPVLLSSSRRTTLSLPVRAGATHLLTALRQGPFDERVVKAYASLAWQQASALNPPDDNLGRTSRVETGRKLAPDDNLGRRLGQNCPTPFPARSSSAAAARRPSRTSDTRSSGASPREPPRPVPSPAASACSPRAAGPPRQWSRDPSDPGSCAAPRTAG